MKTLKKWLKRPLFWITVVLPTTFASVYFGLFATDIYISESSFVVRSPRNQASLSNVGSLLQGVGFSRSQDDTYTVQEYLRSRTALEHLQQELPVRQFYEDKGDLLSRFNPLGWDDTQEAFYQYFNRRLVIDLDAVSGIATLKIRAFNAEEGQQINEKLLAQGEALINHLNERARKDTISFAEIAVNDAEKNVATTAEALSLYRTNNKIFDIPTQSNIQLTLISTLKTELIRVETQLAQLQSITPDNPQVEALKMRQRSLNAEIKKQTEALSGGNKQSLATQTAEYQRLMLNYELAQQQFTTAVTSLQNSRAEADRQQLYLEVIAPASKPDLALEPQRFYNILSTFIIGFMLFGVLSLLLASVREHKN